MFLESWAVHPELIELEFVYEPRHSSPQNENGATEDLSEDSLADLEQRIPSLQRVAILNTCYQGKLDVVLEYWLGEDESVSGSSEEP